MSPCLLELLHELGVELLAHHEGQLGGARQGGRLEAPSTNLDRECG